MDDNLPIEQPSVFGPEADPIEPIRLNEPAREAPAPDLTVVRSPSETRGRWKGFTRYVGGDPDSNIPAIRVDGFTSPDGTEYVLSHEAEATVKIEFEKSFLSPLFLTPLDRSGRIKSAVTRTRRARRNLQKRGLE